MSLTGWVQIALVLALVVIATIPLSTSLARFVTGERTFLTLAPVERASFRGRPDTGTGLARLCDGEDHLSIAGFLSLYALQRLQNWLPLNPRGFDAVDPPLAFNTSVSFITNTNWQNYSGETTMSHLTQMLGLTVHNFVSAATGMAMAFALAASAASCRIAKRRR